MNKKSAKTTESPYLVDQVAAAKIEGTRKPRVIESQFTLQRTYSPCRPVLTVEERAALARCRSTLREMAERPAGNSRATITELQQEQSLLSLLSELP